MHPFWPALLCGLLSYAMGSIPFGFLFARSQGVDIRQVGSGNVGATNVFRCVGKGWGLFTFLCDALKGFVPAFFFPLLAAHVQPGYSWRLLPLLCGGMAIVGHNWPVFLGFKGGKGVATSVGALLGLAPASMLVGIVCWILVFVSTRYVAAASLAGAILVPAAGWVFYRGKESVALPATLTVFGLLIVWRHRGNIRRLLNGTEHRFEFRRRNTGGAAKGENTT